MNRKFILLSLFLMHIAGFSQIKMLQHRNTMDLIDWTFKKGKYFNAQQRNFNDADFEPVKVPHTYSMDAIESLGYYRGETWYRTKVVIPNLMQKERIFIRFEGVGHEAAVFVNGKKVGKHVGGYAAFCFEITNEVDLNQENFIVVLVSNEPNFKRIPVNDKLFNHYGGIYRPVQIFSTPKMAISPIFYASSGLFVELKALSKTNARLEVRTHISNTSDQKKGVLQLEIKNKEGETVFLNKETVLFTDENQIVTSTVSIENPLLWHGLKNPYVYKIVATISSGEQSDQVVQDFGLRTYDFDANKGFILNNESYRLFGVNLHQEWNDVGPALKKAHHYADHDLMLQIGATTMRTAHYQHSDIVYELANQAGILVWTEIPFVNDYSGRENENAKQQLTELIFQNYNHPSIFVWGIWNEVRANKSPDEPCVLLTKELVELAKSLDPSRPTVSASDKDMISNMGNITDLQAWNKYFGWYYGTYRYMATWIDASHKNFPDRPLAISEYGIGGNIYHQDASKLEKPTGDYFPEMLQTKYHEITWKIFKDRPFLWGTYVWTMTDMGVNVWNRGGIPFLNHKGLLTFDRKTKKDAFYFYKANWNPEPMLYIAERRNTERKEGSTNIKVYTNIKLPILLFINGKKIATKKMISDISILMFENVPLEKGANKIQVMTKDQNLKDEVMWNLN